MSNVNLGWLHKKKSSIKITSLIGQTNLRWFKVYNLKSSSQIDSNELQLALCYFKDQKCRHANNYIYLRDIEEISDDGKEFKVISPGKCFTLLADTPVEHYFWLKNLVKLCPNADTSNIMSKFVET